MAPSDAKAALARAPGEPGGSNKTMKTSQAIPSIIRLRRTAQAAAFITLAAFAFTGVSQAETKRKPTPKAEPCMVTARFMFTSSVYEALADYNVALAKANNAATSEERTDARQEAAKGYKEAVDLAREQLRERRDLCAELDEDRYNPVINPADFLTPAQTAAAPNRFFPLVPGTTFNYRSVTPEGIETVELAVTRNTRTILGVTTIVVHDVLRLNGAIVEDTVDWFAQDRSGNVWYFGENTAEYEDGLISSTAGTWTAGVDGAKPGIAMFASPVVGKTYRQELLYGEAEDAAEVIALNENVTVAAGTYTGCLKTEDFTPIDPDVSESKFYAPGVGNVLTTNPTTGKRTELVSVVRN